MNTGVIPAAARAAARTAYPDDRQTYLLPSEGGIFDARAIRGSLFRSRRRLLWILVLVGLILVAIGLFVPRSYRATSSVQIEQQTSRILGTEDDSTAAPAQDSDRFLQTQLAVLRSRNLAERVAETLGLFRDDAFLTTMRVDVPRDASDAIRRERVIDTLQGNLRTSIAPNTRVATIGFDSPDPELAARVANSFAENLITGNLQRRFDASRYARDFLAKRLDEARLRLERAERAMLAYARSANLIDASDAARTDQQGGAPRSITASSLVQLNDARLSATAQRVQAEQSWRRAARTPALSLPEALQNPTIQHLQQERAELLATQRQEAQQRKQGFVVVQQTGQRLEEIDKQLAALAAEIKSGIRQQYEIAVQNERTLAGNVARLKGETLSEQDRLVSYNILQREADTSRQMYEALLQRYKELSAEAGITSNNISILDRAVPPTSPSSPNEWLSLGIAGLAGLGLAVLMVLGGIRFDETIRSPGDVESLLGVKVMGVIPRLKDNVTPIGRRQTRTHSIFESYHTLATAIDFALEPHVPKIIAFTSSQAGEGKSTSALATALDFAKSGRRLLLVDANLRNPSLATLLGLNPDAGLSDILSGRSTFEQAVQQDAAANIDFLAAGRHNRNLNGLLDARRLDALIDRIREAYDLVIFDSPPLMGLADATIIASRVTGTVFVVEANRTDARQAMDGLDRLVFSHANVIGVALTKFDRRTVGYRRNYLHDTGYHGNEAVLSEQ